MPMINEAAGQRPPMMPSSASTRLSALVFLAAVVAFIVYGSLFPFDFVSEGLSLDHFFAESQLFANQSDAVDNFFLFVPLGIALHLAFRGRAARAAAALLSVLVLAIGIQLVQLYLPSRTASLADAFWNTVGMGAGLLAAARVRHALRAQLAASAGRRELFLAVLVLLWFCYESFPFMPTLDIGLLRAHVKSAVYAPTFEVMRLVQHALAAALAGIAVTRLGLLRRPLLGVAAMGLVAMALEVLVAYGNLRRETLAGIALGLAAGYLVARRAGARSMDVAFALALCGLLITVITPYRGQAHDGGVTLTPFSHLIWQGVVNDVPPLAFEALMIGAMLWAGMWRFRGRALLWTAMVVMLLAVLEWVRVALLGFHGDSTTLAMAAVLAPAAAALHADATGPAPLTPGSSRNKRGPTPWLLPLAIATLTVGMWLLVHLPGIPYNLKKLFGDHALAGAAVFSLALLWLGGGPWLVAHTALRLDARRRSGALWTPALLVGIALVSYALVNLATPGIMLEKIIGAPDLYRRAVMDGYWGEAWRAGLAGWPRALVDGAERLVRYVALYSVFSIPLAVGLLAIPRRDRRARVVVLVLCLLPCWVLAKFVVLDWAVTDNLTELIADGGTFWLALAVALFAANAVLPARGVALAAIATALLLGACWLLLQQAIETVVINNGRIFSGMQFLLGQDRTTLLSTPQLFARWSALYLAALAVVASGIVLARRLRPLPAIA